LITADAEPLTLFCLHYLGGSGLEYVSVAEHLGQSCRLVPIDLAGFGEAREAREFSVSDMVRDVAGVIQTAAASRWWLVGHSMGAKVAAVLASHIESGVLSIKGMESLVLLSGSPPSPEPMDDEKRHTMLEWFVGAQNTSLAEAQSYLDQNVSKSLEPSLHAQAIVDLRRMNREAWAAWLMSGSREDWSDRVGLIRSPALLLAGSDDRSLGPAAQRQHMTPHFTNSELKVVGGVTHLLPLEAPALIARFFGDHEAALRG
jgi:pimeloyl-ACP methyl ester carboxylesterase